MPHTCPKFYSMNINMIFLPRPKGSRVLWPPAGYYGQKQLYTKYVCTCRQNPPCSWGFFFIPSGSNSRRMPLAGVPGLFCLGFFSMLDKPVCR